MSDTDKKLAELGITLPDVPKPVAAYVPFATSGNLVFVSGNLPMLNGQLIAKGIVGADVSIEDGVKAARQCAINAMASLKAAAGNLDKVVRILRVEGFVASVAGFEGHPKIVNGASELILEVFGERGRHSRFAVGCSSLPLGAPVEIGLIAEIAK